MTQQPKGQKCDFCAEQIQIHGQLTIQRFGKQGFEHELRLCSVCFDILSRMLCDLMRSILARETAKLKQQMAGLKIG
jgi:hypothetical protein